MLGKVFKVLAISIATASGDGRETSDMCSKEKNDGDG